MANEPERTRPSYSDFLTPVVHPLTYASPVVGRRPSGLITRPVGWPLVNFATVLTVLSFYGVSGPTSYLFPCFVAAVGWMAAMGWWGLKAISRLILAVPQDQQNHHNWWKFLAVPFLFVVTIVLAAEDVPAQLAFKTARPSMERTARAQLLTPDGTSLTRDVGAYGPCEFSHHGNAITVWAKDDGFLDQYGYVYSPAGPPKVEGKATPIGAGWYQWFHKF